MKRGRHKKIRYVQKMPKIVQFSPRGRPGRPDEMELRVDQYEALKLADFQGYDQTEGAAHMGISRPSFGRILREARKVVAEAIVNGKIIRIRVSDVQVGVRHKDLPKKITNLPDLQVLRSKEKAVRNHILKYPA